MENKMKLADPSVCTGCGACEKKCAVGAISFRDDNEGFPTPYIDESKCVNCGMCSRVCPALHMPETHAIQEAYAAQLLDREALKVSTSGGLFTAFSREIFRRGGVVYGCVWDEYYNAVVTKAENEEEMKPMRGSKYVWSWAGDTFPEIKKLLEQGRTVLFTGLPCQVAGLKNYLGKDYDKLYLMDFFCGGAPSPLAFQAYLKTITKKVPLSKLNLLFRDKEKHGVGVNISYEGDKKRINQSYVRNPYFFSYHTKVFHRQSCYHCQYRYRERMEDITIGDYWDIGKYHSEFDIRSGVSALLVNSEKGRKLLEAVKASLKLSETKAEYIAGWNNLTLGEKKVEFHAPKFRENFFAVLKAKGWKAAERKSLYSKKRITLWLKQTRLARAVSRIKSLLKGK